MRHFLPFPRPPDCRCGGARLLRRFFGAVWNETLAGLDIVLGDAPAHQIVKPRKPARPARFIGLARKRLLPGATHIRRNKLIEGG